MYPETSRVADAERVRETHCVLPASSVRHGVSPQSSRGADETHGEGGSAGATTTQSSTFAAGWRGRRPSAYTTTPHTEHMHATGFCHAFHAESLLPFDVRHSDGIELQ